VQEAGLVHRQVSVNDEAKVRQVEAAGRHVGGDADPGMAIAQGLKGVGTLPLAKLTRQADHREAPLAQGRMHVPDPVAGIAEHQGARRFEQAKHIDHRMLDLVRRNADDLVFDVAVGLVAVDRVDPQGVRLIAAGEAGDFLGDGRREHEGPAAFRRGVEDFLQVFPKAHVEHFIGFIQHHDPQGRKVQIAALKVVLQTPRGADDNVTAALQGPLLAPRIHAADAGDDNGAGVLVEPGQLGIDLDGQFPGRRDHQGQGGHAVGQLVGLAQQGRAGGQTEGDGLARAGLGGNQQVAAGGVIGQNGGLDRGRLGIALSSQSARQGGVNSRKWHEV